MAVLSKIFFWAKNYLFPADCALCGCVLIEPEEVRLGLCQNCLSSINADNADFTGADRCIVCGKLLISEFETCISCRNTRHTYDRLWTLFPYTGKYRKLLTSYKFEKKIQLADFFADKIKEIIKDEPLLENVVIVPVPPRPGKIKETGWDQVDYIVKKLEKKSTDFHVSRCLIRGKSKVQKRLNRSERLENLKGRITVKETAPDLVLVIDDVITTGSTMEVCSSVLKEKGTQKVYGLCLFYG